MIWDFLTIRSLFVPVFVLWTTNLSQCYVFLIKIIFRIQLEK